MAHNKQAEKRIRTSAKARTANKAARSIMKSSVKKAEQTKAPEDVARAVKRVDKAAKQGVIHRNAAARKKSRLARKLNAAKTGG